jgi:MFS family permease
VTILDATVVNIALPHIQAGLRFSPTSLAWVMNGYTLTFGGLLLLGGRIGDILGRRRTFLAGIVIFTLASLAGGLANSAGLPARASAARSPRPPCSRWSSAAFPRAGRGPGHWRSTPAW